MQAFEDQLTAFTKNLNPGDMITNAIGGQAQLDEAKELAVTYASATMISQVVTAICGVTIVLLLLRRKK